jgi:hypothetical protein
VALSDKVTIGLDETRSLILGAQIVLALQFRAAFEARVIPPGAQALLGFQLAIVLTDAFGRLPAALPRTAWRGAAVRNVVGRAADHACGTAPHRVGRRRR